MIHKVSFSQDSIEQLKVLDDDAKKKLFSNFITPIRNGYNPDELEGKYKPSWEMQFVDSAMKVAFMEKAREDCLYHYHFGYKYYQDGRDPNYFGKVSDGIVHIQQDFNVEIIDHVIFDICLKHPSPFKVPFMKDKRKVVGL
ncbi:hypothetical protein WNY51_15010 [Pseudocolwellia sp. AS88]|jgi:hypothetical protein|uniref:hypothetical protein n=1 Tax=Pseudocolwellia TaxID=2848177 RepID=UPI0026EEBDA4|nr:hypothetical protein [Pseudocolwellia sp. AS88]MDO7083582.1 hypothetical protein [Pseudocolwellia sp. AS88]